MPCIEPWLRHIEIINIRSILNGSKTFTAIVFFFFFHAFYAFYHGIRAVIVIKPSSLFDQILLIFWRASSLILYCDYCCSIVSVVPLISCGPPLIDFGSSSNLHSWDRQSLRSILRIFQDFFLTIWGWFHPLLPLSILIFLYQIDFITTIQICGSVSNPHLSWTRGSTFGLLPDILLWSVIRSFCGAHAQFLPP